MDKTDVTRNYTKIYRWLGLCIDYYAASEDEDDQEIAEKMRQDPAAVLDALVEIRMALIAFKMQSVTSAPDGDHYVKKSEFQKLFKDFPPNPKQEWWPVWGRFLSVMDELEWNAMWPAIDKTIKSFFEAGLI